MLIEKSLATEDYLYFWVNKPLFFFLLKALRHQLFYPGMLSLKLGQLTDADWYVICIIW